MGMNNDKLKEFRNIKLGVKSTDYFDDILDEKFYIYFSDLDNFTGSSEEEDKGIFKEFKDRIRRGGSYRRMHSVATRTFLDMDERDKRLDELWDGNLTNFDTPDKAFFAFGYFYSHNRTCDGTLWYVAKTGLMAELLMNLVKCVYSQKEDKK